MDGVSREGGVRRHEQGEKVAVGGKDVNGFQQEGGEKGVETGRTVAGRDVEGTVMDE